MIESTIGQSAGVYPPLTGGPHRTRRDLDLRNLVAAASIVSDISLASAAGVAGAGGPRIVKKEGEYEWT